MYQLILGIVLGLIIGLIPSAWMGHVGNRITEEKNKNSLQAKQKKFIQGLSRTAESFITSTPVVEGQCLNRPRTDLPLPGYLSGVNRQPRLKQQAPASA